MWTSGDEAGTPGSSVSSHGPGKAGAKLRGIAMSPKKINLFATLIRRMHVEDALAQCRLHPKKAGKIIAGVCFVLKAHHCFSGHAWGIFLLAFANTAQSCCVTMCLTRSGACCLGQLLIFHGLPRSSFQLRPMQRTIMAWTLLSWL